MAESDVHPGSFVGDSVEEFKKLPPWGKGLALVAVAVVAYLGYRAYQNNKSNAANTAAAGAVQSGASQSPFPSVNGLPLLPTGTNPVYDPNGNLVGYQSQPTPPTGSPPTGSPTPAPPTTGPAPSNPPAGSTPGNPWAPLYGTTPSNFTYKEYGQSTINGHLWTLGGGSKGVIWGVPGKVSPATWEKTPIAPGQKQALYKGGGPMGMFSFMHDPLIYLASATPHKPASVP